MTLFSGNNKQGGGNKKQSPENIYTSHGAIKTCHNYSFTNNKLIYQKPIESAKPAENSEASVVLVTIGPTNIDAKNTWPTYLKISASDLDLVKTFVFIDYNYSNRDYNTKINCG